MLQVRAFYKRCGGASCNCAVAARAGDDVIIVDRCNSMGDVKIWGMFISQVKYGVCLYGIKVGGMFIWN